MHKDLPIVETYGAPQVFCDGLLKVEVDRHGNGRLVFYVEQEDLDENGGRPERHIIARLVIPRAALAEAAEMMLTAVAEIAPRADRLRQVAPSGRC